MTKSQQINFTISPKHLIEIIEGQTDGLDKAFGEVIMNSVDAGATGIYITMFKAENDTIRFTIKDNGRGMSKKDILNYFKVFGNPHEQSDATFGRFRMGRSQLMYYASTVWLTRKYAMSVDIYEPIRNKTLKNLGFSLSSRDEKVDGCHIHGYLYPENLEYHFGIEEFRKKLTSLIRYIHIPVFFNDELISTSVKNIDKSEFELIHEDDFAYYFLDQSYEEIFLYNQGVLVQYHDLHDHLTKGVIITKSSLALDHSRRTILTERCPIFKGIENTLNHTLDKQFLSTFDEDKIDIERHVRQGCEYIYSNDDYGYNKAIDLIMKQPMFYDVREKKYSLLDLLNVKRLTFVEDETPISIVEHVERLESVLAMNPYVGLFYNLRYNIRKIHAFNLALDFLNKICRSWLLENNLTSSQYQDFEFIDIDFESESYLPKRNEILTVDLTDAQKEVLNDLSMLNEHLFKECPTIKQISNKREIQLGDSDCALAWTNGSSKIWFDAKYASNKLKEGDLINLLMTLIHEYCHTEDSTKGHDSEFYEKFHNFVGYANFHKVLDKTTINSDLRVAYG